MLKQTHQKYRLVLLTADVSGLLVSWLLAFYLRFHTSIIPVTKGIPRFEQYAALSVPIVLVWLLVFTIFGIYKAKALTQSINAIWKVLQAYLVAFLCFLALTYLLSEYRFSRIALFYFGVLGSVILVGTRLALMGAFRLAGSFEPLRKKVLIVGDGETALAIAERIRKHPELGLALVGFVNSNGAAVDTRRQPVLGSYEETLGLIERLGIAKIIIALPRSEIGVQDIVLRSLTKAIVDVQLVPDIQEYMVLGCAVEDFDGFPVVALNEAPISYGWQLVKRGMDFILSLLALLVLSPLMIAIAVLIKLTSRGPVFYGQERMGLDGITFTMWKFRSMQVGAESATGPVWAKPNDDRRTPLGAFLRATSLDELPQFWNVLKGQMSLVGPRPERPEFVNKFRANMPTYMYRHKVKAGVTGWAQINGWRGDTSLDKRIEYDLYYIRHWSLAFDFKILFLTLFKGIINKNAY